MILLYTIALHALGVFAAPIDAHRKVVYDFAVTNVCAEAQTIATIKTSCACLKAQVGGEALGTAVCGRTALPTGKFRCTGLTDSGRF